MKLRWKHFLILITVSLVPLLAVTWITQNASRRLGKTISGIAQSTLMDEISQQMVRATRSYADLIDTGGFATEQALKRLAARAELALILPPPLPTRVYYADEFDDPKLAPGDMAPSTNHPIHSQGRAVTYKRISREYPNFLLAPGVKKGKVAEDIDRFTRLSHTLKDLSRHYGAGLIWAYVTLESGVHISYPGHGGYPPGYDPRQRPWYQRAKDANSLSWLPIVDATTSQLTLTASMPYRYPDGSFAGVVGMDIKIAHALLASETTAGWFQRMSSFIVGVDRDDASKQNNIWLLSSRENFYTAESLAKGELSSRSPEIGELLRRVKDKKSGYLDMPLKGVDSIWAYAAMIQDQYFVLVVPKSIIMTLPVEVGQMFGRYSKEQTTVTGFAVVLAIFFVGIVALFTSRPGYILTIIDAWQRVAKGDFSVRLEARMKDERAQLIHSFNEIVPKIEEHMRMSRALGLAKEVQQSLLPQYDPSLPGFDIAGASIYCDETGGDYFDFIEANRNGQKGLAVVVGDVSGHGVSSALLMATARALIIQRVSIPGNAAGIITDVNRHLSLDAAQTGNFMSFFYCELTEGVTQIRWVRAGHDPAIVYDPTMDAFEELYGHGVPLGFDDSFEYDSYQRSIESGQVIVIGTDGIWEMHNNTSEMFGKEALLKIIRNNHKASARQIVNIVTDALEQFRGDRALEDDITLVVIKVD